ncbi:MAG: adenosylcobinamide-GDP ribazoletransferase [Oscillospiraceae bacterium]|nr:adenosylcobinamide-GDP ribazoletransferase [Oscillospiraceae bacterium]
MLRSLCSAFLMYSRIPMPKVKWSEENRRFSLVFFPLVGVVIGGILVLWSMARDSLGINNLLFSAVSCVIPILISGGIHLDGFCDVIDAQSSYAPKEKKLEIMSDPHIGSFAAIALGAYFILQLGLFSCVGSLRTMAVVALGYSLSRTLSAICAITFKSAKNGGTLQSFVKPADKRVSIIVLFVFLAFIAAGMIFIDYITGTAALIFAAFSVLFFRLFSYKNFGGITGDLAGFFLQICEIAVLFGAAAAEIIREISPNLFA